MKNTVPATPVTLVFSAHDPSGAAGIQADIESINHNSGRCVSVLTALTAQNTAEFACILPQQADEFARQAGLLLADIPVHACKTGLIGHPELVVEIARILHELQDLPTVVDPVLHAGTGARLATAEIIDAYLEYLLPLTTVLTPNSKEALALSGRQKQADAARYLLEQGCHSVLITGADDSSPKVVNTLYQAGQTPVEYQWDRLPGTYHGSGCTLAAAIAARLALREDVQTAVENAQAYTWESLAHAISIGRAQLHPDRNFRT